MRCPFHSTFFGSSIFSASQILKPGTTSVREKARSTTGGVIDRAEKDLPTDQIPRLGRKMLLLLFAGNCRDYANSRQGGV
jgi:hypothetical protein